MPDLLPPARAATTAVPVTGTSAQDHDTPLAARRSAHPFISVVVPVLNEEHYIGPCLDSLIVQWPAEALEILVVDGGSTDATRQVVRAFAQRHPAVRLIANPRRIQSAAMNLAAVQAAPQAALLVRADAHALYPPGFIQHCVADLLRTGATSVVVPMRNEARAGLGMQRAIAAAQSSRLGNGGAAHRTGTISGFVEHGHHAAFDRAFFLSLGGYDESFTHNEDAELDVRAVAAGGRIWMCAEAPVQYFPRTGLKALAAQYVRHGRGRARTLLKHRRRPKLRQMAPVAALSVCAAGVAVAPVYPSVAAGALSYPLICLGWGAAKALRKRDPWLGATGAALMVMHIAWAIGFLRGVAQGVLGGAARAPESRPALSLGLPEPLRAPAPEPAHPVAEPVPGRREG